MRTGRLQCGEHTYFIMFEGLGKLIEYHRFAPGLMMMEFVALFFPLQELYRRRAWLSYSMIKTDRPEDENSEGILSRDTSFDETRIRKPEMQNVWSRERIFSSEDFLQFAATRDFTAGRSQYRMKLQLSTKTS
jgi:hypothetical protein